MSRESEELFNSLYVCDDPDCTATHVDMTNVSEVRFEELP